MFFTAADRSLLKIKSLPVVVLLVVICSLLPSLAAAEQFIVSTTENPFPVKDEAAAFMTRVYAELGRTLTLVEFPQQRSLMEADAGHVDAELFRAAGMAERYTNLIQVPGVIARSRIYAYVRRDCGFSPQSWSDLNGLVVGYTTGAKIVERKLKGARLVNVKGPQQLFEMVKNGRLDAAIYTATEKAIPIEVVAVDPPLLTVPVYHYLHRKNAHLLEPLQESIRRLAEQEEAEHLQTASLSAGQDFRQAAERRD